MAFTPDGKTLVCVEDQSVVLIWNAATGKLVRQLTNGKRGFFGLRSDPFSPDSKLLAVNDGDDRNVLIYELATGKLLRSVNNGGGEQCFNLFSPDNQLLATFSDGARTICVWEVASGKKLSTFAFELEQIWSGAMAFSPDSKALAFASGRYIKLGDVHSGKEIHSGNEKKE
jgi:WD40 repeat protein